MGRFGALGTNRPGFIRYWSLKSCVALETTLNLSEPSVFHLLNDTIWQNML